MPNRNTIIHITLGLRQIMFPDILMKSICAVFLPSYFIGHTISKLYNSLSGQIQAALMQNCKNAFPMKRHQKSKRDLFCIFSISS